MAKKEKGTRQKKKKGRSTQELLGIKTFTKYGLQVGKHELLYYLIAPTNISVLSRANVEIKIRHLMMVLSAVPDIEITCTDSCDKRHYQIKHTLFCFSGRENREKNL